MGSEHLAEKERTDDLCANTQGECHPGCGGWLRCRRMRVMQNGKERAELNQKVLTALALCPPAQGQTDTILQVRYNPGCGRWEPISRTREMAYGFLVALTMVTVLMGIGEIATYYGIAALYGFHRIW